MRKWKPIAGLLVLVSCVLGNEPIPPEPYDYYAYSGSPYVMVNSLEGLSLVNEAAGCNLVGLAEPGEYVLPMWRVESHDEGPEVIGCAHIDEMFSTSKNKRPIRLVSYVLESPVYAPLLVAHEVGHTLGLHHTEDGYVMAESINNASSSFTTDQIDYLKYLCTLLPTD